VADLAVNDAVVAREDHDVAEQDLEKFRLNLTTKKRTSKSRA
jgi:hypothetical protein